MAARAFAKGNEECSHRGDMRLHQSHHTGLATFADHLGDTMIARVFSTTSRILSSPDMVSRFCLGTEPGTLGSIAPVPRYSVPLSGMASAPLPFLCIGSSIGDELVADPIVPGRRVSMGAHDGAQTFSGTGTGPRSPQRPAEFMT